ncbi:MAG: UvrD-helicase domain-containing protein, partial [Armatimonadota bacterium]
MSKRSDQLADAEARRAAAEDLEHSLLLSAGAGTGKTRTLVDRYVNILASAEAEVAQIVAVTFTEKAAKEMKERIRAECRKRAEGAPDHEQRRAWEQHERELENARIGTIHALCARILRENCLAAGLDPRFAVLQEDQAGLLLRDSVRRWVLTAIERPQAPARCLVTAFGLDQACSVITGMLDRREDWDGWDLARDADPAALLTRWSEAAGACVDDLVSGHAWQGAVEALRIHEPLDPSDKMALARQTALAAAEAAGASAATEERAAALREIAHLDLRGGAKAKWHSEQDLRCVKDALKRLRDTCRQAGFDDDGTSAGVEENSALLTAALCAVLPEAEKAFSEAKLARSALDFADLQLLARDLLRDNEAVRRRLQSHTRHVLVDEFQDTNRLQKQILDYLAACQPDTDRPPRHPTFAVGDAKQSIYRFRGADVSVFAETRADFAARQGCRQLALQTSFRGQPALVAFANQLFSHEAVMGAAGCRPDYEAHYESLVAHRTERAEQPDVEIALATQAPGGPQEGGEDEEATLDRLREVEADWIARRILDACGSRGLRVYDEGAERPRPAGFGDLAILFRSMSKLRIYERALRQHGVPYYVVAGRGLYARQEIRDVLSFLRALENRHDQVALAGVLRSPFFGVSDKTLYWLTRGHDQGEGERLRPLPEGLHLAGEGDVPREDPSLRHIAADEWPKLQRAWDTIEALRAVRDRLSLSQLIERIVADTAFQAALLT